MKTDYLTDDGLLRQRRDAIYTPLETAVEELHKRRRHFAGRTPGRDWLPAELPVHASGYAFSWSDPFITTACLRRGAFNGMTRRDWRIFFASFIIANGWWALACFGGIEAVSKVWEWFGGTR